MTATKETFSGIYALDGDDLKTCFDNDGKEQPSEFATKEGSRLVLMVFRREPPAKEGDEPKKGDEKPPEGVSLTATVGTGDDLRLSAKRQRYRANRARKPSSWTRWPTTRLLNSILIGT